MAGKEGIFAILDINSSMDNLYNSSLTRLQFALESIRHLIRQKLLFNLKDNIGIILKGSEQLINGIEILKPLAFPSIQLLHELENIKTQESEGDLLLSIENAIEAFKNEYGKKKWNKRIFIFTDGESSITKENKELQKVSKLISDNEVKVNIIAINFFDEIDQDFQKSTKESQNQLSTKHTLKVLSDLCENVKVFTAKMADTIYKQFRKKKVSPVTKFRGQLVLTPSLSIDIAVYSKTSKVDLPSLKKYSLATEVDLEDVKSGGIQLDRVYYVNDDPDQNPLPSEYITKAYNYGSSLIPISKTDEVLFKNSESKCLKMIGFTDNYRVPRHHFMTGVDFVIPNPLSENDQKAFTSIVIEMISANKVMICRYVYRENSDPKLVILSPKLGKKGAVLYLNTLPSVEDIRDFQFESLKECTMKQEEVVSKFIDSLDLEKEDENGEKHEVLKPTETFNPILQYFYQCLEHKALNKDNNIDTLPPLDESIGEYIRPDKNLFEGNKYVTFLPKAFEIKEKEKKEDKKKRVFWREIINTEISENTGISEKKLEEKLEAHKEEAKKSISTTSPIEDFTEMLNYKYKDLTVDALEQMKEIIIKFIVESFKGSYYTRALDCIKVLRDACLDEDEIDIFNIFLNKLRLNFPKEKFMDFWKLFIDNRIMMISSKENVKSSISEEECRSWLDTINNTEVLTSTVNDMDELIADID